MEPTTNSIAACAENAPARGGFGIKKRLKRHCQRLHNPPTSLATAQGLCTARSWRSTANRVLRTGLAQWRVGGSAESGLKFEMLSKWRLLNRINGEKQHEFK